LQKVEQDPQHYNWMTVAPSLYVIAHIKEAGDNPKICIPDALLDKFIEFYHLALAHAGMQKVTQTMTLQFWHPRIHKQVEILVGCCGCQESKKQGIGYGHLPF